MRAIAKLLFTFFGVALFALTAIALHIPPLPTLERLQEKEKGKRAEEDEDDAPKMPKKAKSIRVEEDDEKPAPGAPPPLDVDFAAAAAAAKNDKLRDLYESLTTPHDEVYLRTSSITSDGAKIGGTKRVALIAKRIKEPERDLRKEKLKYRVLDTKTDKPGEEESVNPRSLVAVRYYEQIALEKVKAFIDLDLADMKRYQKLQAAEAVLSGIVRFHESARSRGDRAGDDEAWADIATALRKALLGDVLLGQLEALTEAKSWDAGFALARRLVETYSTKDDHKLIAGPAGRLMASALQDKTQSPEKMSEFRKRLEFFQTRFPDSAIAKPLAEELAKEADSHFQAAKQLVAAPYAKGLNPKARENAKSLARRAAEIWPDLPGLRQYLLEIDEEHRTLRVSMRGLPKYLSPGMATTDAEWRATDLIFESLVEPAYDRHGATYYRQALALRLPTVIPGGREVRLARNAAWSDGKPLRTADINYTLKKLHDGRLGWRCRTTGQCAELGTLLSEVQGSDSYKCRVIFVQGLLDPHGAMSFKVLPAPNGDRHAPDSEAFAEQPVGSGPFKFASRASDEGRQSILFMANQHYARLGREGLPLMSGVRFLSAENPVEDLQKNKAHLALDLTEDQFVKAKELATVTAPWPALGRIDRRVWFLATSKNSPSLNNASLRLALAHAINRKALLDEHFRKSLGEKDRERLHRQLTGPFPPASWASPKNARSASLYDEQLARSKWKAALKQLEVKELRLTLKYPTGDDRVKTAIEALCKQVAKVLPGLELHPQALSPYDLRKAVEETGSFDLAYYSYDYPDESCWLTPLLKLNNQVRDPDSKNSLGEQVEKAMMLRNFDEVRKATERVHRQFVEVEMPFVPLWQLDSLYAYRTAAVTLPKTIDARRVFAEIEKWRVLQGE